MHSYLLAGIRMGPLMTIIRKRGFTPTPQNIGRFLFLFQNSLWSSILTWREKKLYGERIRRFEVPDDPVIIIGHWRTGSTFLHQLLSLDSQFVYPTVFQAAFPDSFLASSRYFRPVFKTLVNKRPMDNVRLGFDDPQEDEFALLKITPDSPLLDVILPARPGYFLNDRDDFLPGEENREAWKKNMGQFCAKVRQDTGKTLLLKNPFHSLRIPVIKEVFPKARYIYIHRHPYNVVASSLNLWKVMAKDNQLKGKPYYPNLEEVTKGLVKFYDAIERDLNTVPKENQCDVSYERLEKQPEEVIRELYRSLGLVFTSEYESSLKACLHKEKDFKKNSYTFDDDQKARVYQFMKKQFEHYHYMP